MANNLLDYVGLGYFLEKIKTLFVTGLGTSGNNLTWTKNGTTNNITIPYATEASKLSILLTKTYENVLRNNATYTSPYTNSYLYFGSVKTIDLTKPSHIKYRVLAYAPSNASYLLESIVEWYFGNSGIYKAQCAWNNLSSTSYYPFAYHTLYYAKTAAIATSDGSYLGCYFGSSNSYGQSASTVARTIKIDILECNNCTVNLLDNVVWLNDVDNVPANLKQPSTSKAYNDTNFTAANISTAAGLQETADANTNTIGYLVRTNSYSKPMKAALGYGYRLLFTSADLLGWVPANTSTSSNATAARTPCTEPIDPFGEIVYYAGSAAVAVNSRPGATSLWQQYAITFGYSFNTTGAALTLTSWKPVYIKCTPLTNGSAVIEGYTQDLPTSEDGYIYIYLGVAYAATTIELVINHPVYWYKDGAVRLYGSGNSNFIVNLVSALSATSWTVDKTSDEVYDAYLSGSLVYFKVALEYGDVLVPLIMAGEYQDLSEIIYSVLLTGNSLAPQLLTLTHSGTTLSVLLESLVKESDYTDTISSLEETKEDISNKITSLSSSSTNTQYPSAKLLYDLLALKLDDDVVIVCQAIDYGNGPVYEVNKTFSLITLDIRSGKRVWLYYGDSATPEQYLALYRLFPLTYADYSKIEFSNNFATFKINSSNVITLTEANYESTINKVTSLSASSTNTQYPSAKCVYDSLNNTKSFIVSVTEGSGTTLTVDKTAAEAYDAYSSGRAVYLKATEYGEDVLFPIMSTAIGNNDLKAVTYSTILGTKTVNALHTGTTVQVLITDLAIASDLDSKENNSNKVTSISSSSTDTLYPSAKAVYDVTSTLASIANVPTALADLTDDSTHRLVTDTEKNTWNSKLAPATTLAGYGITDANILNGIITLGGNTITPLTSHLSLSDYVNLSGNQSITGEKTFTGDKRIKFKQGISNNKLGFTLYNYNDVEVGYLEWLSSGLNSKPTLVLGQWRDLGKNATHGYLGFKMVDAISKIRYMLVTPLLTDAKTPLELNDTIKTFYFPLLFKNGSTKVITLNTGEVDLSTLVLNYEITTNKVTSINSSSTDTLYPSAKCVYDAINNVNPRIPITNHGTSDTTFALTPNIYHKWGSVSSLTLTLAAPDDASVMNEYIFSFTSTATPTTLSLPASVEWVTALDIEASKLYRVSIIDNLATWITSDMVVPIGDVNTPEFATKAYVDAGLALKENSSNKVTSVDENSTDTLYPSAKAMYDALNPS